MMPMKERALVTQGGNPGSSLARRDVGFGAHSGRFIGATRAEFKLERLNYVELQRFPGLLGPSCPVDE